LYSYVDKASLVARTGQINKSNLSYVLPLPMAMTNLADFKQRKNSIIVNIERETTVTTVIEGNIYRVDTIDKGMQEILDNIVLKENSYEKAYEICKNSTIYTLQGKDLQTEENEYMEEIMPTLYSIVQSVKEAITLDGIKIDNIYITGMGAVINNIDLYFQENFINQKCEILAPFFAEKTNVKVNIKDYIEVNSAIALALQGVGEATNKEINFTKQRICYWINIKSWGFFKIKKR